MCLCACRHREVLIVCRPINFQRESQRKSKQGRAKNEVLNSSERDGVGGGCQLLQFELSVHCVSHAFESLDFNGFPGHSQSCIHTACLGAHPFSLNAFRDPQDCPLDRKFQAHQSSFPSAPGDEISL